MSTVQLLKAYCVPPVEPVSEVCNAAFYPVGSVPPFCLTRTRERSIKRSTVAVRSLEFRGLTRGTRLRNVNFLVDR